MMSIKARILDWWDDFVDRRRIHQAALYWHRQGVLSPYSAAHDERYLRLKLEEFRNFASRRYLEDSSLTRDEIKQEWLERELKPMARSEFGREDSKAIKAAIAVMGDEMFFGEARAKRRAEIANTVTEANGSAGRLRTETRRRALDLR